MRRYPNTHVDAVKAISNPKPRAEFPVWSSPRPSDSANQVQHPILFARLASDIFCYGFNLEEPEAKGDVANQTNLGWYFALAERFGEPRFGLDIEGVAQPTEADKLAWENLTPGGPRGPVELAVHKPQVLALKDHVLNGDMGQACRGIWRRSCCANRSGSSITPTVILGTQP